MTAVTQRRVGHYVQVLAQKASAPAAATQVGCDVLDILAQSLPQHEAVSNLVFWPQDTLNCYTPSPEFEAAHSVLADASAGAYPAPDTRRSAYNTVQWSRVSGTVNAQAVLPDGHPAVHEIKILDSDPAGRQVGLPWAFQTVDLGKWKDGLGAKSPGQFDESRGVAVTLRLGTDDAPPPSVITTLVDTAIIALGQSASDPSSPGDVRVTAGNIWSVLFPAGGDPVFEKRFPHRDKAGNAHEWVRLHTFTGATADRSLGTVPQWLVTFVPIAGRLLVSVNGHSIAEGGFCFPEADPAYPASQGHIKTLRLQPAAVRVTGRAGGGPRWVGIRRIGFRVGQFSRLLSLGAANPPGISFLFEGWQNEVGDPGIGISYTVPAPTEAYYTAQVRGTADGRTTAALKWVRAYAPSRYDTSASDFVDYGGAVTPFEESMAEPDFFGGGGTRGSDGSVDLTFDLQGLDLVAAATPGADWRRDLGPYAPVTFVLGQTLANADGTGQQNVETARLFGYLESVTDEARGFADGEVKRTLRDGWLRLKEPAAFVDTSFAPLSVCLSPPDGSGSIYGWQGVQLILSRMLGLSAGQSLRVFLPQGWYGLAGAAVDPAVLGKMVPNDLPLLNPPFGKYAAEWIKEIALMDFAALYPAGNVWVYGHFDLIVAGTPTYDVYDGRSAEGAVPPDSQLAYTASALKRVFNTGVDYNHWVVWGDVPGGLGNDAPVNLGVPLVTAQASDFPSIGASWRRTKLYQGGQFYDQAIVEAFIRRVKALSDSAKTAAHLEITFDFALPEVFWGHKMTLHGFLDIKAADGTPMDGKTFRVYKMTHSGDMMKSKVRTRVRLVEMLGGEN